MAVASNCSELDSTYYNIDEIENERRIRQTVKLIGDSIFFAHIVIALFGICANGYVVVRVIKLARKDPDKYNNGAGIGLLSMSIADILCLFSITIHHIIDLAPIDASEMVKTCVCKILLFSTHTMTSVSIWSWLLMSAVRYLAIRHPMAHLRLWNMPKRAILFFWLMSSATNVWLLFAIDFGQVTCEQNAILGSKVNLLANLVEMMWSACLPITIIFYMDVTVMCGHPFQFVSAEVEHESELLKKATSQKHKSAVRIWLTMAFIGAVLNIPDNFYRILMLINASDSTPSYYHYCGRMIAQLLYFGQFAFNALYLAVFVYDKSTAPRFIHYNSLRMRSIDDDRP